MERPRARAAIAFGGNVGDVERTFKRALSALERSPGVVVLRRSPWRQTSPVGGPSGQPDFLNGVVLVETTLSPRALFRVLRELEARFGRDRSREERRGPRTLDLDLLLFAEERMDEPDLVVPHPRLEERAFVLEPLAALAPDWPLASGRTAREAWEVLGGQGAGA